MSFPGSLGMGLGQPEDRGLPQSSAGSRAQPTLPSPLPSFHHLVNGQGTPAEALGASFILTTTG